MGFCKKNQWIWRQSSCVRQWSKHAPTATNSSAGRSVNSENARNRPTGTPGDSARSKHSRRVGPIPTLQRSESQLKNWPNRQASVLLAATPIKVSGHMTRKPINRSSKVEALNCRIRTRLLLYCRKAIPIWSQSNRKKKTRMKKDGWTSRIKKN